MSDHQVQRTLVKSPPELWAEVSDPDSLRRRLSALGQIEIVRTEPETTVAWEGENVSGTVALEPSGWGTKVTIEAMLDLSRAPAGQEPEPEPVAVAEIPEPQPDPAPEPQPASDEAPTPKPGFFARLFGQSAPETGPMVAGKAGPATIGPKPEPAGEPESEAVSPPEVEPTVTAEGAGPEAADTPVMDADALEAALNAALDDLGAAHHRPFSRS